MNLDPRGNSRNPEGMRIHLVTPPVVALCLLGACVPASDPEAERAPGALIDMANPASVYCTEQGGILEPGSPDTMCHLPDGRVVEEWQYYRANH